MCVCVNFLALHHRVLVTKYFFFHKFSLFSTTIHNYLFIYLFFIFIFIFSLAIYITILFIFIYKIPLRKIMKFFTLLLLFITFYLIFYLFYSRRGLKHFFHLLISFLIFFFRERQKFKIFFYEKFLCLKNVKRFSFTLEVIFFSYSTSL